MSFRCSSVRFPDWNDLPSPMPPMPPKGMDRIEFCPGPIVVPWFNTPSNEYSVDEIASSFDDISMHMARQVEAAAMVGEISPATVSSLSSPGSGDMKRRRRWWVSELPRLGWLRLARSKHANITHLRTTIARHTNAACNTRASETVVFSDRISFRRASWSLSLSFWCRLSRFSRCSTETVR